MRLVSAPAGYDGSRCYIDGARQWQAGYRKVGARWWTTCGYIGHPHLTDNELDSRASDAIVRHIAIHEQANIPTLTATLGNTTHPE